MPRPATPAPPADLAQVADALEPPLEPLTVAPEPAAFDTRGGGRAASAVLPDASATDASSSAADASAEDALSEPPETFVSGRATRGARPILGRLALCRNDPSLAPYEGALKARRLARVAARRDHAKRRYAGAFAESYREYGVHPDTAPDACEGDVRYVEYAPGASRLSLMGDFNDWTPWEFEGEKDELRSGCCGSRRTWLRLGGRIRVAMQTAEGGTFDRIPAWIRAIAPCEDEGANYHNGVYYDPPEAEKHVWRHGKIRDDDVADYDNRGASSLRIYEAHVGMSSEAHGYGTYRDFADTHLRRIADLGYSAVQLMAVADHA